MRITNATSWEKRNLGCPAFEVEVDYADLDGIGVALQKLVAADFSNSYVVVKMPVGNLQAVHSLEEMGFRFVETQLKIVCDLEKYSCPRQLQRLENYVCCEVVAHEDSLWQKVVDGISEDMFVTDRVYLDPAFGRGVSATRYRNWIMDMRKDSRKTMCVSRLVKTGELIAFDVLSSREPFAVASIGGVYPGRPMMGIPHMLALFKFLKEGGARQFGTSISSNNLPMMKVYAQLGGVVCDERYVLRRFDRGKGM